MISVRKSAHFLLPLFVGIITVLALFPSRAKAMEVTTSSQIALTKQDTPIYVAANAGSSTIPSLPAGTPLLLGEKVFVENRAWRMTEIAGKAYYVEEDTLKLFPDTASEAHSFLPATATFDEATGTLTDTAEIVMSYKNWPVLQHVILPNARDHGSFKDCVNLETVQLDSMTDLSYYDFEGCDSLTKLAVPNFSPGSFSVTESSFAGLSSLQELVLGPRYFMGNQQLIQLSQPSLTIYVPNGCMETAKRVFSPNVNVTLKGYDAPVLKTGLAFNYTTARTPQNCFITSPIGTTLSRIENNNFFTVSPGGDVTVSMEDRGGYYYGRLEAETTLSVGEFQNMRVKSNTCWIYATPIESEASSFADNSIATVTVFVMHTDDNNNSNRFMIAKGEQFTFRSYDDCYYQITYNGKTGYIKKSRIGPIGSTLTESEPSPGPSGGDSPSTPPSGEVSGNITEDGIRMTIPINGKDTEVLLALNNFTYDYDEPEYKTLSTTYNLRKGPDASFGTFKKLRKGARIKVVGRDGRWLKVDIDGKTAYVLEDMTEP